jgi:RNA ligase
MRYDTTVIESYVERSLLDKCDHKTLPISIYKYSRNCQFERIWDNVTLNMRGTVLDDEGNIVARTFPKFFNMEEEPDYFSDLPFEVFSKLDGSLGILFFYAGEWHLATQGSFYSDQAIYGKEILDRNNLYVDLLSKDFTYLFEIIY